MALMSFLPYFFLYMVSHHATADVLGIPTIACRPDGIEANINLTKPFMGRIYLRGHYSEDGCFHDFSNSSTTLAKSTFSFESCHMRRKRQSNPNGLKMSAVMIVSHHPKLITYRDKAYNIECFYAQSDASPVSTDLNVSSSDEVTIMKSETSLPKCNYLVEMKSGKINESDGDNKSLQPIVTVGDEVTHIWTCADDQPNNLYCMQVHSCVAEDDSKDSVMVVDSRGCSLDKELLSTIQYSSALRASASSRVFKFADRSDIRFQCQIRLTVRRHHLNETCPPPECTGSTSKRKLRKRRSMKKFEFDVETEQMTVLDTVQGKSGEQNCALAQKDCTFVFLPFGIVLILFFVYLVFTICYCFNMRRMSQDVYTLST